MREEGYRLSSRHFWRYFECLKHEENKERVSLVEAGRRDDGEVDRGKCGLEGGGVVSTSRPSSGYLRPLTLPPPLTTIYGKNKQDQTYP